MVFMVYQTKLTILIEFFRNIKIYIHDPWILDKITVLVIYYLCETQKRNIYLGKILSLEKYYYIHNIFNCKGHIFINFVLQII